MLNLETLQLSPEAMAAVQDKQQLLLQALDGREATPENVTQAMLDCGRLGDYEALLEQNRLVKQGGDQFLTVYQEGLEGRDTAQVEPAARELTNQLADEAKILWSDPSAAQAAADSAPFLTAAALNWAQAEGDIQSELPPELLGVQSAAVTQAAKCLIADGWDWQAFWSELLEVVTAALLLSGEVLVLVGISAELAAATAELLLAVGFGLVIAALVSVLAWGIVEEDWDQLMDFFASIKAFWRRLFHGGSTQEEVQQEAAGTVPLSAAEAEAVPQTYA